VTSEISDTGLPIESVIPDVRAALDRHRRAVLTADPGAGKTTVVPLRLLDEPWLAGRRIVMLEPRRLAARASAARMASLLGERVGETVGVTTRDDRRVGPTTRIEVVTEGILTRRLQRDPELEGCGLIIFDEFHERSQQADLGLALLLDAQRTLDLETAVLVMSATIDAPRVAELIGEAGPAPVIECEGRTFDVDMHWRPRNKRDKLEPAVVQAVEWVLDQDSQGDVLVFLPGMAEIRRTQEQLRGLDPRVDVVALHGSLPLDEQDRAVAPSADGFRKVVLSTDIAESSLTVEGVTAVVDSGLARAPRFDPGNGLTRLTTISVSRASADQRAGRAGRLSPGIAVRLWSKIEHGTRAAFGAAEITEVDLAQLRLELAAWGVSDPATLPMLDSVPTQAWNEAGQVLHMLGALDEGQGITDRGRKLAELPLHPRLGAVVLAGVERGVGAMGCALAALIDERDVLRGRPAEVPADLGLRLDLLMDRNRRHALASGRSLQMVRARANDLARRIRCNDDGYDRDRIGLLVAAGFPDRVAQRRGSSRGRFRLRNGSGVRLADTDQLAGEEYLVAIDLDGKRKDARVRIGAAVDVTDLLEVTGFDAEVTERTLWDRDRNDVVTRVDRHLGALDLGSTRRRPPPSAEVVELLLEQVKRTRLKALTWTDSARALQSRVEYVRTRQLQAEWPDLSDKNLLATLDTWLGPLLVGASGRADLEVISVSVAFDVLLGRERRQALDAALPAAYSLPTGRNLKIDYRAEPPTIKSRAQDFYGVTTHPAILNGDQPLTVELLSPAGRPIQRTADLPGFWDGSWAEVRKDMAGRYPKHDWPADPRKRGKTS
jgi:ATP-dependent helicase HrpB